MRIGIVGAGSWATALAKILTTNHHTIHWWVRNAQTIERLRVSKRNPYYLTDVPFSLEYLVLSNHLADVVAGVDVLVVAIPSAYIQTVFAQVPPEALAGKKVVSAVKGIVPAKGLLNDFLQQHFAFPLHDYAAIMGPCHAEEIALEKTSFLTIAAIQQTFGQTVANLLRSDYVHTRLSQDIVGVQYAAVLKNIYALGAGIAKSLQYGDNFLSVYTANAHREMVNFLQCLSAHGAEHVERNPSDSVYLGDLLVTCYSPHSRNRRFGEWIGAGLSVGAAQQKMNMIAEGVTTAKDMFVLCRRIAAHTPILDCIYHTVQHEKDAQTQFVNMRAFLQ